MENNVSTNDNPVGLFTKVICIYLVKEMQKRTGLSVSYSLVETRYCDPKFIEQRNLNILFENRILSLDIYHQSLRFLISSNDLQLFCSILEKKGYSEPQAIVREILSKTVIGMSVIAGKKIPLNTTLRNLESPFDVGHREKFQLFEYRIQAGGYPPFTIHQVVHEALLEQFSTRFLAGIQVDLPFIELVTLLCQPFIKLFASLEPKPFFYPVHVEIRHPVTITADNVQIIKEFVYKESEIDFSLVYICDTEEASCEIEDTQFSHIFDWYVTLFNSKEKEAQLKQIAAPGEQPMILTNCLVITLALQEATPQHSTITDKPVLVKLFFPEQFLHSIILLFLKKPLKIINRNTLSQTLDLISTRIKSGHAITLTHFTRPVLKPLRLDPEIEDEKPAALPEQQFKTIADLHRADDRLFQMAMPHIKRREMLLLLKGDDKKLTAILLSNMSKRTREDYEQEMSIPIKVKPWEMKAAMQKLLSVVNGMADNLSLHKKVNKRKTDKQYNK